VKKIDFTGMLTHGQSNFYMQYIDPHRIWSPDRGCRGAGQKGFAQQIAVVSGMEYRIIKSTDADKRAYRLLL